MTIPKERRLLDGPVQSTLLWLALPMLASIMAMVAFNLADTWFVARLGTAPLAAMAFTFPVVFILVGLTMGIGNGATVAIARAIGQGDRDRVRRLTTDSLLLALVIVGAAATTGLLTIDPLFTMLGAGPELLPLIRSYMTIWYSGMIFLVVPMVGNQAIRATGDTKTAGGIMMVAVVTNCILDPMLIFGFGPFPRLEIAGAAWATLAARCVTLILSLYVLIWRERMVSFRMPPIAELLTSWREILYVGLPTALSGVIAPLATAVVTRLVAEQGAAAVAGYGVASRVEFFCMAAPMSLATVLGPFTAQNQGAENWSRVREGIRFCQQVALGFGCLMGIQLAFAGGWIGGLFDSHPEVIAVTALHLAIVPAGWGAAAVVAMSNTALNSLRRPLHATGISIVQMFLLLIPFALIGSNLGGLRGIFAGIAVAQLLGGLLAWQVLKNQIVQTGDAIRQL